MILILLSLPKRKESNNYVQKFQFHFYSFSAEVVRALVWRLAAQTNTLLKHEVVRLLELQRLQIRQARELDHGRRSAHEYLRATVARRRRQMLLNHFLGDESHRVLPPLGRPIHRVMQLEPPAVLLHGLLQLLAYEDVVLALVGVQQGDGDVGFWLVAEDGVDDLEHGGDSRASGDHSEALGGPLLVGIALEDGMDGEVALLAVSQVSWLNKGERKGRPTGSESKTGCKNCSDRGVKSILSRFDTDRQIQERSHETTRRILMFINQYENLVPDTTNISRL